VNSFDSNTASVVSGIDLAHLRDMSRHVRFRPVAGILILLALLPLSFSLMVQRHHHARGSAAHSHSHPHPYKNSHQHSHPHHSSDPDSHVHLNFCGIHLTLPDWFPGIAPRLFSTVVAIPNSLTALPPTISGWFRSWNALAPNCLTAPGPGPAGGRLTDHDSRMPDCTPDQPPVPPPQRSTHR
jgi:hypothetical protein